MIKTKGFSDQTPKTKTEKPPHLKVAKIGIVSRDYRHKYENRFRDFSAAFPEVLPLLDREGCDTVLFSLYSIDLSKRKSFRPHRLSQLRNVKAVLYEEFKDGKKRKDAQPVVFYRRANNWHRYPLPNWGFATLKGLTTKKKQEKVEKFVRCGIPGRTFGNCCAILCGEINGVPWSQKNRKVGDRFGLRKSLPEQVTVVLNPGHDRMIPYQMKEKRRFLSRNDRWVISVWNRGKRVGDRPVDGTKHPWTVFHNGREETEEKVVELPHQIKKVEIGILYLRLPKR